MAGKVPGVVAVKEVQGSNAVVSLPLVGFPNPPNPGEKVAVLCDEGKPAVYPFWGSLVVDRLPEALEGRLTVEGRALVFAERIHRDDEGPGNRYALFFAENESPEVPRQVVAIRRVP